MIASSSQTESSATTEKRTAAILGGAGFIGTRLAGLLEEQKVPFRIGDIRRSEAYPNLWTECDVRKQEALDEVVRGADAIVNLAAAHRDDVRPLSLYYETNVQGAEQVCLAARKAGIQRVIFTSSVAVYGFQPSAVDEEGPFEPFNAYGATKLQAESVYRAWADEDSSRTLVIARPAVVFGETNRGNVYNLLHQIASGRFMMVGSGKNIKSMAYVGNVAAFLAHVFALGRGTHVFNYVDGPDMETRALVELIRHCLGQTGSLLRVPKSAALAGGFVLDATARITGRTFPISAIRVRKFCESTQFLANLIEQSGFVRPYTLREGLERTVRYEFPVK